MSVLRQNTNNRTCRRAELLSLFYRYTVHCAYSTVDARATYNAKKKARAHLCGGSQIPSKNGKKKEYCRVRSSSIEHGMGTVKFGTRTVRFGYDDKFGGSTVRRK